MLWIQVPVGYFVPNKTRKLPKSDSCALAQSLRSTESMEESRGGGGLAGAGVSRFISLLGLQLQSNTDWAA